MVAGVAAGIADRLGVERWIIRLAFVLLSAGGGSGVLLYIAAWLLMPEEGEPVSVGQRWANQANGTRPWVGVVLVLIAAAILFSNLPFFDGGLLFPTALLVIGILLYRGDLPGIEWKAKPRDRRPRPQPILEITTAMTTTSDSTPRPAGAPVVVEAPHTPIAPGADHRREWQSSASGFWLPSTGSHRRSMPSPVITSLWRSTILGLGILTGTFFGKSPMADPASACCWCRP